VELSFDERVYAVVRLVPAGRVTTYGRVAALAGAPGAARQVGRALRQLPPYLAWGASPGPKPTRDPDDPRGLARPVPWHRVVNAQGRVSPRGDGSAVARQVALLRAEGIAVADDGTLVAGLERVGWWPDPSVAAMLSFS
jgi:methylated-DNA-protein-cysteine methyltransferase-like protein